MAMIASTSTLNYYLSLNVSWHDVHLYPWIHLSCENLIKSIGEWTQWLKRENNNAEPELRWRLNAWYGYSGLSASHLLRQIYVSLPNRYMVQARKFVTSTDICGAEMWHDILWHFMDSRDCLPFQSQSICKKYDANKCRWSKYSWLLCL